MAVKKWFIHYRSLLKKGKHSVDGALMHIEKEVSVTAGIAMEGEEEILFFELHSLASLCERHLYLFSIETFSLLLFT